MFLLFSLACVCDHGSGLTFLLLSSWRLGNRLSFPPNQQGMITGPALGLTAILSLITDPRCHHVHQALFCSEQGKAGAGFEPRTESSS